MNRTERMYFSANRDDDLATAVITTRGIPYERSKRPTYWSKNRRRTKKRNNFENVIFFARAVTVVSRSFRVVVVVKHVVSVSRPVKSDGVFPKCEPNKTRDDVNAGHSRTAVQRKIFNRSLCTRVSNSSYPTNKTRVENDVVTAYIILTNITANSYRVF